MSIQLTTALNIDTKDLRQPAKLEQTQAQVGVVPIPHAHKVHPTSPGEENALLTFIGTSTTIIEWRGLRIMTDPNFLLAGDHVHLGPGIKGIRLTNPSIPINQLPPIHLVLLSHYHEDHFDKLVEDRLRRDLPIITTPHAAHHLTTAQYKKEPFTAVTPLDVWQEVEVFSGDAKLKVIAMPGKHVSPGLTETVNDALHAIPPTNGWMVELLGDQKQPYRIYISGDTLLVDELKQIPERYPNVNLMLIHLGGMKVPAPNLSLLKVTMEATQGLQLIHLINPDITIPVHFDDYDVYQSPLLKDFRCLVKNTGLGDRVMFLGRGDQYAFRV